MKLMKIKIDNIELFEERQLEIDFIAEKKVYENEIASGTVTPINNRVNYLNLLSFIGINASGKTIILKLIKDIISIYLENESLSKLSYIKDFIDHKVTFTVYLYDKTNSKMYKIISEIFKKISPERNSVLFGNEILFEKRIGKDSSKKDFFDFSMEQKILERREIISHYLKNDDSIFSGILNVKDSYTSCFSLIDFTNINFFFPYKTTLPDSLLNYLDPSIEFLVPLGNMDEKNPWLNKYKLKFKGNKKEIIGDSNTLESYLSSGTIRGLRVITDAMLALRNGGYLIIDEIENHFNKAIVINLIQLFNSKLNKNGATLLFSTHYTEIIDVIDRTDSIYLTRRDVSLKIEKLSKVIGKYDRKDKVKSDLILSGIFGTAPKYKDFLKLQNEIKKNISIDKYESFKNVVMEEGSVYG
ncbi:MAG: AAA family ATPase [Saccharofermentanales bacterium]